MIYRMLKGEVKTITFVIANKIYLYERVSCVES